MSESEEPKPVRADPGRPEARRHPIENEGIYMHDRLIDSKSIAVGRHARAYYTREAALGLREQGLGEIANRMAALEKAVDENLKRLPDPEEASVLVILLSNELLKEELNPARVKALVSVIREYVGSVAVLHEAVEALDEAIANSYRGGGSQ